MTVPAILAVEESIMMNMIGITAATRGKKIPRQVPARV